MRNAFIGSLLLFSSLIATTATAQSALFGFNFHEIDPGKLYRSAQMPAVELDLALSAYDIRTVINLRGANPGRGWYDEEKSVTQANGVLQVDISMSAKELPTRQNLIKLLDALKNSPRPILVHCQAGADRTGEASALYQMLYMNKSRAEAMAMLAPRYGHLRSFMPAKDYFIEDVWQGEVWARTDYEPCSGKYRYFNTNSDSCRTPLR